jgi:hypothetical protein
MTGSGLFPGKGVFLKTTMPALGKGAILADACACPLESCPREELEDSAARCQTG